MILWEGGVAESLVDFRWRASGDGLSVGGFLGVLCHGRLKRLGFWLFLRRFRDALAARTIFQTGAFIFTAASVMDGSEGAWVMY